MERIGVAGLGRMGAAMARKLAAGGNEVTGWTRSGREVEGIEQAEDLGALVADSDVLVLSLFDDAAVAEVLDALLEHDLSGRLVIETSTVVPDILKSRAEAFAATGADIADAPISGGPEMVEAGTCGFFVGAAPEVANRAEAVLKQITGRVLHVGPVGAGMVMKTINNAMMQAYFAGLSELLPLAKRGGIPLRDVLSILNSGPAGLPLVRDRMPKIMGEDETVGFTVSGVTKDNAVFQRVLEAHGLSTEILPIARARQEAAIEAGLGGADPAQMIAAAYDKA